MRIYLGMCMKHDKVFFGNITGLRKWYFVGSHLPIYLPTYTPTYLSTYVGKQKV